MEPKLTFKIELRYLFDNKKVVFSNEICNNGIAINIISVGNDKIIEKTINGRILSAECSINGVTCGYDYIYDSKGNTLDLKPKNPSITIRNTLGIINKFKKSQTVFNAKINGLFASKNFSEFISSANENFLVYKEVKCRVGKDMSIYFLQQQFSCINQISKLENEEETYQLNNDFISFITEFKKNAKNVYYNIDDNEIENINENNELYKKAQSIINQLSPLKKLLNSCPSSPKMLTIKKSNNSNKKNN